jgi:hypothetical protein
MTTHNTGCIPFRHFQGLSMGIFAFVLASVLAPERINAR